MDSNYKPYDFVASFRRLDEYFASAEANYEERDSLPDRDDLTFHNGYYANCAALVIDIRDSSSLPKTYRRPALAKIYRAFISETVAILNGTPKTREVNIVGDCVWAAFNTPYTHDIDRVFQCAFEANSLLKTFGYKMQENGYTSPIRAGIGMAWGRALMIKAGYRGSGINDVVYMGDVVNRAAHLAAKGSRGYRSPLMVDSDFYGNLNEHNQGLLGFSQQDGCYSGFVIDLAMEEWHRENCS